MASHSTSLSLLDGLRRNDAIYWDRFLRLYGPLVYNWCLRFRLPEHEAPDVMQEVFQVVMQKIGSFRRAHAEDSFHGWLYGITRIKTLDKFRQMGRQEIAIGGSRAHQQLETIPSAERDSLSEAEMSNDRHVLFLRALDLIQAEFEIPTWKAFWRVAIDGIKAGDVAEELGMTPGAVYNAKYKVLRRLRMEFEDLIPFPKEESNPV